jgi:hypothetical protein
MICSGRSGSLSGVVVVLTVAALAACNPCGATLGCDVAATAGVVGQIVDEAGGRPVAGVRVTAQADSGVAMAGQSRAATTGADGGFELELPATGEGIAHLTLQVSRDGKQPYTVPLIVHATTNAGDASVQLPWIDSRPRFYFVVVIFRENFDNVVGNAIVEFDRASGPLLYSADGVTNHVAGTTGENGWVFLMEDVWTDRVGTVVGTITIRLPAPGGTVVVPNASFTASQHYNPAAGFVTIPVP